MAWILVVREVLDLEDVSAQGVRHEREMVREREVNVAGDVVKELDQLRSHEVRMQNVGRQSTEQQGRFFFARRILGANDLGQRPQLLVSLTFDDSLRAERQPQVATNLQPAVARQPARHVGGGPWCDGTTQAQQLACAQMRTDRLENGANLTEVGLDMVVQRSANRDHDRSSFRDDLGGGVDLELA